MRKIDEEEEITQVSNLDKEEYDGEYRDGMPDTESEDIMQLEQMGRGSWSFVAIAPEL